MYILKITSKGLLLFCIGFVAVPVPVLNGLSALSTLPGRLPLLVALLVDVERTCAVRGGAAPTMYTP